ncbi:MAG: membrane protein insertion efficiency factor YidD [Deltaproteobacteria bacterium]|nr:membrane protein insertion efficiency factor YidD [Deltaproteobacteria bacterium]
MHYLLLKSVRAYQLFLSPWFAGSCRFYPSCSEYFRLVLQRDPWWKALLLMLKRLLKCHQGHPGGVDLP